MCRVYAFVALICLTRKCVRDSQRDDTDDGFDKQGHEHFQQGGNFGVDDVDLLVLFVQLAERHELFQLFDKRLDNGNAGEILLCKV